MKRILHRCNTYCSIDTALKNYDGFECDVMIQHGYDTDTVVIAHDADDIGDGPPFADALEKTLAAGKTVAINVKAHRMHKALAEVILPLAERGLDYFLFDVPGVELHHYERAGLKVFGRVSIYEKQLGVNGGGALLDPITADATPAGDIEVWREHALISHGCHGRLGQENQTEGIDYLIGKEEEFV